MWKYFIKTKIEKCINNHNVLSNGAKNTVKVNESAPYRALQNILFQMYTSV